MPIFTLPVYYFLTIEKSSFIFQVLLCFLLVISTFASRFKGKNQTTDCKELEF